MKQILKTSLLLLLFFTVLTGVIYPVVVTLSAQLFFPTQANGSLITDKNGTLVGSRLIGQSFTEAKYLWGRPSATAPTTYNASASSGSNLGTLNPALLTAVQSRIKTFTDVSPQHGLIPVDLITYSGSGLDPHISPAAAAFQAQRIAQARHLTLTEVQTIIARYTEPRQWQVFGEPRVNVLFVNLALDQLL